MATRHTRLKAGDVLELKVGDAFAYMHYLGKHRHYGDAVVVIPKLYEHPTDMTREEEDAANGYIAFYPASAAVAQALVEIVGHLPPPAIPRRLRRAGARSGSRVVTWVIEDDSTEVVRTRLSDDELQLPIAAIWNHEFLVQRITAGWSPTKEGAE